MRLYIPFWCFVLIWDIHIHAKYLNKILKIPMGIHVYRSLHLPVFSHVNDGKGQYYVSTYSSPFWPCSLYCLNFYNDYAVTKDMNLKSKVYWPKSCYQKWWEERSNVSENQTCRGDGPASTCGAVRLGLLGCSAAGCWANETACAQLRYLPIKQDRTLQLSLLFSLFTYKKTPFLMHMVPSTMK